MHKRALKVLKINVMQSFKLKIIMQFIFFTQQKAFNIYLYYIYILNI